MAEPPREPKRGRNVALCVSQWNHPTTFYAFTWCARPALGAGRGAWGTPVCAGVRLLHKSFQQLAPEPASHARRARQWLLRRGGEDDARSQDNLLIVRVGKHLDETDRWKVGGPLMPDLDTALERYPHQILKLQGSIQSQMRSFTEQHDIDVVVLGERAGRGRGQLLQRAAAGGGPRREKEEVWVGGRLPGGEA